mmetsp:Transcript_31561/g.31786  ORF Transcript_31561/g.31786 Transcript_31561/m.31786 type:complete len:151 (-) Transcript_31561:177-629(-)
MGQITVSRGVRSGGEAFTNIQSGTYYPAVSIYMGAAAHVNFGPYFIYPPVKLPTHFGGASAGSNGHTTKLRPVSELSPIPPHPDEALAKALKERSFPKKTPEEVVKRFWECVNVESLMRYDTYQNHLSRHLEEVRTARSERNLSTSDLNG